MRFVLVIVATLLQAVAAASAQNSVPTILAENPRVSIRDGDQLRVDSWVLAPEENPDVYRAELVEGQPHRVAFITDRDSVSFVVELGRNYDFIVDLEGDLCHTRIVGTRFTPAAVFDESYQSANRGKILVEIPEVYELVNVAIAISPFGRRDKNFVYHDSSYYSDVIARFGSHSEHPFVTALDSLLTENDGRYSRLKMNGYAFEFDSEDRIVQSRIYDRTGFRGDRSNALRPHLKQMQSFADLTRFRSFYAENEDTYGRYVAFFSDSVDVSGMKEWLDRELPESNIYDLYKIIFSPLVSYNQSSTSFESNGFKELQPHVNFPYRQDTNPTGDWSPTAELLYRGNIVFTEINHGYLNPESEKHSGEIAKATSNRGHWVEENRNASYYRGNAAFNEYMNWGLVVLRLVDYAPVEERDGMIGRVERMMARRGFIQFESYNRFLMRAYLDRSPETTLADLYPAIISWFAENN